MSTPPKRGGDFSHFLERQAAFLEKRARSTQARQRQLLSEQMSCPAAKGSVAAQLERLARDLERRAQQRARLEERLGLDAECTFAPKIEPASVEMARKGVKLEDRVKRELEEKKAKFEKERAEMKETQEASKIEKDRQMEKIREAAVDDRMYLRSTEWKRKAEEKTQALKHEREEGLFFGGVRANRVYRPDKAVVRWRTAQRLE